MSCKGASIAAAAVFALANVLGIAGAQERRAEVKVDAGPALSHGMAHRASEIQGMTVKNAVNKELGTVKDIVIDVRAGQVKYAALSYGGFLGVGDKLFAVPWELFEHRHDASKNKHTLVLNIDEGVLKRAPGFDESHWPNFADPSFADEIRKHYGPLGNQRASVTRDTNVDVNAGRVQVNVEIEANRSTNRADRDVTSTATGKDIAKRASEIIGMTVKNLAGKDLGSVNDLLIGMETGKVRYAALSYGGILGLGDKLFAVPWKAFDCKFDPSQEKYHLVLAVDEATLRNAPGFDQNAWPNFADPKFGAEVDRFYEGKAHRGTDKATDRTERPDAERSIPKDGGDR
jgi:sporulation protein YlmC with PRC-barrel domain